MYNTNADAIDKAFLSDLTKGVKIEPTVMYDSLVNTIVVAANMIRRKGSLPNERTESS